MGVKVPGKAIGGADTNLKKTFPTRVVDVLFRSEDAVSYIEMLSDLSPRLIAIIRNRLSSCSERKFGEWIDLHNQIDATLAKKALYDKVNKGAGVDCTM